MKRIVRVMTSLAFAGIMVFPLVAAAQYSQDFEGLIGSPTGVMLTGQDLYYLPNGTGDTDFMVYTYAGNSLGIVQNPAGGAQFIAATRRLRALTWSQIWRRSWVSSRAGPSA